MTGTLQTVYLHGSLVLSIVERNRGERIVAITRRAGAHGGTIVLGRGTAESSLLELLSIGDSQKDVVFTIAADDQIDPIMTALRSYEDLGGHSRGVVMQIDVSRFLKHVMTQDGTGFRSDPSATRISSMNTKADHVLITFILNRGYADDVMIAARKAGAKGGTILNARGTGTEEYVKFFGIALVPEKDILLILAESGKSDAILEAVKHVPCLSEPGSGIAYCIEVEDVIRMGKNLD